MPKPAAPLAALLALWLGWHPSVAPAATDPRIIERYQEMLSANPVEGTVLERLWKIAQQEGKTQEWIAHYKAAADRGEFPARMIEGLLLRRAGQDEEALAAFRKAATMEPKSPLPYQAMALLEKLHTPQEYAQTLTQGAALLPKDDRNRPALLEKLGQTWIKAGDTKKAAQTWEEMLTNAPDPLPLRARLASLYAQNGMTQEAITHYRVLQEQGDAPARMEAFRAHARLLATQGEAQAAMELLEKAIYLTAPGSWLYEELLGEITQVALRSNLADAIAARWKEATSRGDAGAFARLAALEEARGEPNAAREALAGLAALTPDDPALKLRRARLARRVGEWKEAAQLMDDYLVTRPPQREEAVLERAALDVALGEQEKARQRLEKELPEGEPWEARRIAFYQTHRMTEALEARLSRPGADPEALAQFLYARHRPQEARAALGRLVPTGASPQEQAQAYARIATLLNRRGERNEAVAALENATRLQPNAYRYQLDLGDLLLQAGAIKEARARFEAAYHAAKAGREQIEADRRLFQTYLNTPQQRTAPGDGNTATRAMETILSLAVPTMGADTPPPDRNPDLLAQLEALSKATTPEGRLRHARWTFWNRDPFNAKTLATDLTAQQPGFLPAWELLVTINRTIEDREGTVAAARRLAELDEANRVERQRELAQLLIAQGDAPSAIPILTPLAVGGDPAILAELANAHQQADQWYDALTLWERLYAGATPNRKGEYLPAITTALKRLGLHEKLRELYWQALVDSGGDSAILNEFIAYSRERRSLPWLLDKLENHTPAAPWQAIAMADVLRIQGHYDQAYATLQTAAEHSEDRAGTQQRLVAECEARYDFANAARHQEIRLRHLPEPSAAEWARLAHLQADALDEAAAVKTWEQAVRRFPTDVPTLLEAADFIQWSDRPRAVEIARQAFRVDPASIPAAHRLLQWSTEPSEATAAARRLLQEIPSSKDPGVILPSPPASVATRLQSVFYLFNRSDALSATFSNARELTPSEREIRLEAIDRLAKDLPADEREAWLGSMEQAPVPQQIRAALAANDPARAVSLLKPLCASPNAGKAICGALIWTMLDHAMWPELASWLGSPKRSEADHEVFLIVLREWLPLNRPLPVEAVFAKIPPTRLEAIARLLASQQRLTLAAALGGRIAPIGAHNDFDYLLSQWRAIAGEPFEALLQEISKRPAEELTAPTFGAQVVLYHSLAEPERAAWISSVREAASQSPLFRILTEVTLGSLEAKTAQTQQALDELLALRPVTGENDRANERVWRYRHQIGMALIQWGFYDAARNFWENALKDSAAIAIDTTRTISITNEIANQLLALELRSLPPTEAKRIVRQWAKEVDFNSLEAMRDRLNDAGYPQLADEVVSQASLRWREQPLGNSLLTALITPEAVDAAVKQWVSAPEDDLLSSPAVLDWIARTDRPRAILTAERLLNLSPADRRVREQLAQYLDEEKRWGEAIAHWRELVSMQPGHPPYRLGLAESQLHMGEVEAARATLAEVPRRSGETDVRHAIALLDLGRLPEALKIAEDLAGATPPTHFLDLIKAFAQRGQHRQALMLVRKGVATALATGKPRAAYLYQRAGVELLEPSDALTPRWLAKARGLADRPEFVSDWYELATKHLSQEARIDTQREAWEKHQDAIGGAWLVVSLLEAGKGSEALPVIASLMQAHDLPGELWEKIASTLEAHPIGDAQVQVAGLLYHRTPTDWRRTERYARLLHAKGDGATARLVLERAGALALFSPPLRARVGALAWELGEAALAQKLLPTGVAMDTAASNAPAHRAFVRLAIARGDFDTAKRALRRYFANPNNTDTPIIIEYLQASGRSGRLEGELRDIALPPELAKKLKASLAQPEE